MASCKFGSLVCLGLLALVAGCAPATVAHTPGEIPRDTNGRPVWSLIEPSVARAPNG